MRCLTEIAVVISLLACSVSAHTMSTCTAMTEVYSELVGSGYLSDIPTVPFSAKTGQVCGSSKMATCCSRSMETSFTNLLRSLLNITKAQTRSFSNLLQTMGEVKETNLAALQQKFRNALSNSTNRHCRGTRPVKIAIHSLFSGVFELYSGITTSLLKDVVTFFYRIAIRYLQPPFMPGVNDYGFKLCVANWGHHGRFTQNSSNLIRIACCLDKFVLLSKRIAVSLFALSSIMANMKSDLLRHSCPRCKEAFVEKMLCHRCTGQPTVGSCPSVCTDVIYRCFPGMVALNDAWNDVLDSVDELINETGSFPDICSCMSALESSLEVVCKTGAPRKSPIRHARTRQDSDRSLIRRMVERCSDSNLTNGTDNGIADFLSHLDVSSVHRHNVSGTQANATVRGLGDAEGEQYNMRSPSSCLGNETSGSGDMLEVYNHELRRLRDIMLPQGEIFTGFCKSPNSSQVVLVSHDTSGTCWNGIDVINVNQDKHKDYSNSSQALASQAECQDGTYQGKKHSLYRTCCTKPEQAIIRTLKNIADRNRAFLCQNQDSFATSPYCEQCRSALESSDN